MRKSTKRLLILVLLLIFAAGGGFAVLYAQGLRFDFAKFAFKQVGAIYVRSFPQNAAIQLDGVPIKNDSGIFQSGTFVNSLFPKNYTLELSAPGYRPWKQTADVLPAQVAEFGTAVLVPEDSVPEPLTEPALNFWNIHQDILVRSASSGTLIWRDRELPGTEPYARTDPDRTYPILITVNMETSQPGDFFLSNLEATTTINVSRQFAQNPAYRRTPIGGVWPDPASRDGALIGTEHVLLALDTRTGITKAVASTTKATIGPILPLGSQLYWTQVTPGTGVSDLMLLDRVRQTPAARVATVPGTIIDLADLSPDHVLILEQSGLLYQFDAAKRTLRVIARNVRRFTAAPGGARVAAIGGGVQVIPIDGGVGYARFNFPNAADIVDLAWYRDGAHLVFFTTHGTLFFPLDDRSLENIVTVTPSPIAHYDGTANAVFALENQAIVRFDFPK